MSVFFAFGKNITNQSTSPNSWDALLLILSLVGVCIDALCNFAAMNTATKVQPYYGFEPSIGAGEKMTCARERMGRWLNVHANEVHFSASTSQNT